jgi:glycosyltransferase involved in cell wall biosynthesis
MAEGTEKVGAFLDADVCVVPSFTENFGMVVAEALVHGVPVIASKGTPWADLERQGCGLWVDNSPESIGAAILRMNQADLPTMGMNGRAWMETQFSWANIASQMEAVYRRLT